MSGNARLTGYTRFSGCGAKLGPGLLDKALCELSQPHFEELLVDYRQSDDAGVWKINDETALVQTVDFFPPIVDDSFSFGRIAAANALSDIYAMGGRPITAMSIVAFPAEKADISVLRDIMRGALDALAEAEAALVGGHSIQDDELKFGLAVTGLIRPEAPLRNNSPLPGNRLVLTKALGTGCINRALRAGKASAESAAAAERSMSALNRRASEILSEFSPTACTDVTGFGLLGHACEMVSGSGCTMRIFADRVEFLPGAEEYVEKKLLPAGTARNRDFRRKRLKNGHLLSEKLLNLLFDPQTSGGLLAALPGDRADEAVERLRRAGVQAFEMGETIAGSECIEVLP